MTKLFSLKTLPKIFDTKSCGLRSLCTTNTRFQCIKPKFIEVCKCRFRLFNDFRPNVLLFEYLLVKRGGD